jgi:toxin ParE1/3/4
VKLVWSHFALADRDEIFTYIRKANPAAAISIDGKIAEVAHRLKSFPDSGRSGRIDGTREIVVLRTPYIIAYIVLADRVRILRVLHGARIWPDEVSGNG